MYIEEVHQEILWKNDVIQSGGGKVPSVELCIIYTFISSTKEVSVMMMMMMMSVLLLEHCAWPHPCRKRTGQAETPDGPQLYH